MKRFVKEFAEHEIRTMKRCEYYEPSWVREQAEKIRNVVKACELGMVTEAQACWSIAQMTR